MVQHIDVREDAPHAWENARPSGVPWSDVAELAEAVITSSSPPAGFVRGQVPIGGRRADVFARRGRGPGARTTTVVVVFPPPTDSLPPRSELRKRFGLTPRETEVALLLAARRSNKEIARHLSIAPKTAARHTQAVLAKLNTSSRRDVATRLGRVPPGAAQRRRGRAWTV
jgi:DNA-binding CsgD family transcriptional regulator